MKYKLLIITLLISFQGIASDELFKEDSSKKNKIGIGISSVITAVVLGKAYISNADIYRMKSEATLESEIKDHQIYLSSVYGYVKNAENRLKKADNQYISRINDYIDPDRQRAENEFRKAYEDMRLEREKYSQLASELSRLKHTKKMRNRFLFMSGASVLGFAYCAAKIFEE